MEFEFGETVEFELGETGGRLLELAVVGQGFGCRGLNCDLSTTDLCARGFFHETRRFGQPRRLNCDLDASSNLVSWAAELFFA
jgi:hypothetical protein